MNDNIKSLITKHEEPGDFSYAKATDSELELAEKELNLTLPSQYVEFLKTYGHGGICGVCTDGIGLDGSYVFVENTLEYRAEGLPENLIVVENADEWLYCIDANTGKVVSWDMSGFIKEEYDSFDDYLIGQMNDAIENM